jgi:hypothetical protein
MMRIENDWSVPVYIPEIAENGTTEILMVNITATPT